MNTERVSRTRMASCNGGRSRRLASGKGSILVGISLNPETAVSRYLFCAEDSWYQVGEDNARGRGSGTRDGNDAGMTRLESSYHDLESLFKILVSFRRLRLRRGRGENGEARLVPGSGREGGRGVIGWLRISTPGQESLLETHTTAERVPLLGYHTRTARSPLDD